MAELKREYEEKLREVSDNVKATDNNHHQSTVVNNNNTDSDTKINDRIKTIKDILIGGERANDTQLKEKRFKKKLAAQKKIT
jgi:hypothetical protein